MLFGSWRDSQLIISQLFFFNFRKPLMMLARWPTHPNTISQPHRQPGVRRGSQHPRHLLAAHHCRTPIPDTLPLTRITMCGVCTVAGGLKAQPVAKPPFVRVQAIASLDPPCALLATAFKKVLQECNARLFAEYLCSTGKLNLLLRAKRAPCRAQGGPWLPIPRDNALAATSFLHCCEEMCTSLSTSRAYAASST